MKALAFFISVSLLPILSGCASLSAAPISAQVVDADTHQPLAGVVVVAHWELHRGSFTGDALPCGEAGVEEAVTDQDGGFHIPGWGPVTSSCDMRGAEPSLILFKSGYHPKGVNNPTYSIETVSVSRSFWDGKTIELSGFPDMDLRKIDPHSYSNEYYALNDHLLSFLIDYPGACNWEKVPDALRAILAQDKAFNVVGVHPNSIIAKLITNDEFLLKIAPQCGSPKAFIDGLEK